MKSFYTHEEVAKTFASDLIEIYLGFMGLPYSYSAQVKIARNIVRELDYNDVKSLSIYLSKNYYKDMPEEATIL